MIKKYWPHITSALALTVTLYQLHGYVYQSGYNAGQQELISAHNKALEQQRKEYEQAVQDALNKIAADHAAELARIESAQQVEIVTQEVIKYVTKEIAVPAECDGLAADVVGVLSKATSIVADTARAAESADTRKPAGLL